MQTINFGTKEEPGFSLVESSDLIALRTYSRKSLWESADQEMSVFGRELADATLVFSLPDAGVEVYRVADGLKGRSVEHRKIALRQVPDVRFAGGVLVVPETREPVLYTENVFVKFKDDRSRDECEAVIAEAGLTVKMQVGYAENAYFTKATEGIGQKVFDLANALLRREDVVYCHPELIRRRESRAIHARQWHLKRVMIDGRDIDAHADVEAAHALTLGEGVKIAVIDDGVDIDHVEFRSAGKIVFPRDASLMNADPRPRYGHESHGTACAGVVCAEGVVGASGVAPKAHLMPIRLSDALGSQQEADAFYWAAEHGADIISCSWGPEDGDWRNPHDPRHRRVVPLPASTRLAIDHALSNGRGGKGCVVLFAAGNGNEPVENDGYASYPGVIAVAACNDRGTRSVYSDYGSAIWCAFPSNDYGHQPFGHPPPWTSGIWTTDRSGSPGYNHGDTARGDSAGDYTSSFGGTSSACPGAAGVAALVLSANPDLTSGQVKDMLKRACDRIDVQNAGYDASGHSRWYGFGRLNARRAVELARMEP